MGWIYTDEVYILHAFKDVVNKTNKFEQTINNVKMYSDLSITLMNILNSITLLIEQ